MNIEAAAENPGTAMAPVTIPSQALAALRQKAAIAAAENWKPEPGETLEGVLIDGRTVTGPFGGEQVQAIVQPVTGEPPVAVWLNDWLMRQFRNQGAAIGDLVSIAYGGKGTSARGLTFNKYAVTVVKPDALPIEAEAA